MGWSQGLSEHGLPSGYVNSLLLNIAQSKSLIYQWKMMMFHRYVGLPEGKIIINPH